MQLFQIPPPPTDLTCTPDQQALVERDTLLANATSVTAIQTADDNQKCAVIGASIQKLIKDTKATGLDLRRPYNAAADAIKAAEDAFVAPLKPALDRLGRLASGYRQEQERKAEVERQARAAEIARLQAQEMLAAEAARKAAEKGDLMATLNADIKATALAAATSAAVALPPTEAPKTTGQSFKARELGWECTDPIALWNARPDLCNPPTPKASAIKATCSPERPVPGLKLWWESKVSFKASR